MDISVSLEELGHRICILGPSNSGKSTLASAIAAKTSLPLIHLDQLHHQLVQKWIPRKPEDFHRLHAEAVNTEKWVMDGNYTKCLQQRLARATGLILLNVSMPLALLRYIKRLLFVESQNRWSLYRKGQRDLGNAQIHHADCAEKPASSQRAFLPQHSSKVMLKSSRDISACCQQWGLELLR